jgi:hypothetical protein
VFASDVVLPVVDCDLASQRQHLFRSRCPLHGSFRRPRRRLRTSRWWTTAICGILRFWGITHFVSSLGSCVGGATAIALCAVERFTT